MSIKGFCKGLKEYTDLVQKYINDINTYANRYHELWKDESTYLSRLPIEIFEIVLEYTDVSLYDYHYFIYIRKIYQFDEVDKIPILRNKISLDTIVYMLHYSSRPFALYLNQDDTQDIIKSNKITRGYCNVLKTNFLGVLRDYPEAVKPLERGDEVYYFNKK